MKLFRLLVPILAGLLLASGALVAFARGAPAPAGAAASPPLPSASETNLLPSGFAEMVHADASGRLWITEVASKTLREFDPATHAYTLYTGAPSVAEAQLGPDGKLWWLENSVPAVARMDLSTRLVVTYPLSSTFGSALTFDGLNRVWIVDLIAPGMYRLNPATNQACDVDLPDGGGSGVIAQSNGMLWVGDVLNGRIARINPTTNGFTYWPLESVISNATVGGFTFGPNGEVWWADTQHRQLGRLEPAANRITLFSVSGMFLPEQVAYQGGKVWFTDPFTASLGFVDPAVAAGGPPRVVTPVTTALAPSCITTPPSAAFTAGVSTGVSTFSPVVFTTTVSSAGTFFTAPAGGGPWGLAATRFDVWVTDTGRDTLIHLDAAQRLYLPLVRR